MMEWFDLANHWLWWLIAIVLMICELLLPGIFFLWSGVAAIIMGLLVLVAPEMNGSLQLFIFAILSVMTVLGGNRFFNMGGNESDEPLLNMRGEQYIGRQFTLSQAIVNEYGRITVDDTQWRIRGDDCEQGMTVRVVGVDGVTLIVEPAKV